MAFRFLCYGTPVASGTTVADENNSGGDMALRSSLVRIRTEFVIGDSLACAVNFPSCGDNQTRKPIGMSEPREGGSHVVVNWNVAAAAEYREDARLVRALAAQASEKDVRDPLLGLAGLLEYFARRAESHPTDQEQTPLSQRSSTSPLMASSL